MKVTTIGVDLAKAVFQVHGVDSSGKAVVRKRLRRSQVLPFFAQSPECLIGMEECRPLCKRQLACRHPKDKGLFPHQFGRD